MSDAARTIAAWYDGRIDAARAAQRRGQPVVGCIGVDVPHALIAGAGLYPLRLDADVFAPTPAADRFGTGGHPVLRSLVDRLLGGPYEFVDHLVVGTTPRNLAAIATLLNELHDVDPAFARFHVHLHDVLHATSTSARAFNRGSLQALRRTLADWAGRDAGDEALRAAIADANRLRRQLDAFAAQRADGQHGDGTLALRLHACLGGGCDAGTQAAQLGRWLQDGSLRRADARPRVLYSGSSTDTLACYAALEQAGLLVIDDDQDAGARGVGPLLDESLPPLDALAEACAQRTPVAAGARIDERRAWLRQRIAATRPDAVVFWSAAYDHPPAWEYPLLRTEFEAAGLPHVLIDPFAYRDAGLFATGAAHLVATLAGRHQEIRP